MAVVVDLLEFIKDTQCTGVVEMLLGAGLINIISVKYCPYDS